MQITLEMVKRLHSQSGAGYLEAKKALVKTDGDVEKAVVLLRRNNVVIAEKKALRAVGEGRLGFYRHAGDRIGALVEIRCESDFAAETESFKNLAHDLAMHVTAMDPDYVSVNDIPPAVLAEEKNLWEAQARDGRRSEAVVSAIVEGKMLKYRRVHCLLDQPYFRDSGRTVADVLVSHIAAFKENITVRRFVRYEVGK